MKRVIFFILILYTLPSKSQNEINWDGIYKLQLSDFQSPATQIGSTNVYSLNSLCGFTFSFYMSNAEFIFTKNFNSKVSCTFSRTLAALVAPDSAMAYEVLNFARFDFDLAELYARKCRQKLYENKKAFSNIDFFKPVYEEVQKEFLTRHTNAAKETDIGRDSTKLIVLHAAVMDEIAQLPDFCKACKPNKKK
jgi:hypothetical protein